MPEATDQVETAEDTSSVGAGLDALDTPTSAESRSWARHLFRQLWPPILVLVAVVAIWQPLWAAAFCIVAALRASGGGWLSGQCCTLVCSWAAVRPPAGWGWSVPWWPGLSRPAAAG